MLQMKTAQEGCNWKHVLFIALTQLEHLLIYPNNMLYTKIGLRYKGKSQGNSRNVSPFFIWNTSFSSSVYVIFISKVPLPLTEILWYVIKFLPAVCCSSKLICMFGCLGIHGQVALRVSLHIHFLIQVFEASWRLWNLVFISSHLHRKRTINHKF